ncbi:MAG: AFG1 family ATPase [Arenicella sp.]|nr:AFG1 family ATPase [Arenicella sp.]
MPDTPLSRYHQDLLSPDFEADQAQQLAVENLQRLYDELINQIEPKIGLFERLGITSAKPKQPVRGLYFWGGVGRGKTYLVDTFYECLPFENKLRMHFHRFMRRVHNERKLLKDQADPLIIIGKKLASEARVLCFDEFVVNDVADAVILVRLMRVLFDEGVTLVATSNVEPKNLYLGGLQRDLFIPAIDMIYQYGEVINIDSGIDYRLRFLDKAETFFSPINSASDDGMENNFKHLAPDAGKKNATINVEGRELNSIRRADGVIWFEFDELCDGPRSQNDYIELARCFHSILLSNVPVMDRLKEDQARRFINLVDVFYDHNVKLIVSAEAPAIELYVGTRVAFEFQRTVSRLQEMQSHDYLALSHKT